MMRSKPPRIDLHTQDRFYHLRSQVFCASALALTLLPLGLALGLFVHCDSSQGQAISPRCYRLPCRGVLLRPAALYLFKSMHLSHTGLHVL